MSFCVPTWTFMVHFYIDSTGSGADPQTRLLPLVPQPVVSANLSFVTDQGQVLTPQGGTDNNPTYNQVGYLLQPSFGETFSFSSATGGGTLTVTLQLQDGASGTTVNYQDKIQCGTIPCV